MIFLIKHIKKIILNVCFLIVATQTMAQIINLSEYSANSRCVFNKAPSNVEYSDLTYYNNGTDDLLFIPIDDPLNGYSMRLYNLNTKKEGNIGFEDKDGNEYAFDFDDFEGITYLYDNYFAMTEEKTNTLYFLDYIASDSIFVVLQKYSTGIKCTDGNKRLADCNPIDRKFDGIESITYNPTNRTLYLIVENSKRLYSIVLPSGANFSGGISLIDKNIKLNTPLDVAGIFHLGKIYPDSNDMLLLSEESQMVYLISENGNFNPVNFSVELDKQPEGLVYINGDIYIASEADDEQFATLIKYTNNNCFTGCATQNKTILTIKGCTNSTACNYNPNANCDDNGCDFGNTACTNPCSPPSCPQNTYLNSSTCTCETNPIVGCINQCAPNYNPNAEIDDGSCSDYDTTCNQNCNVGPFGGTWDAASCNCINEIAPVRGCTNSTACNYNPNATCDDDSCDFGNAACINPCSPPNCPQNTNFNSNNCTCEAVVIGCRYTDSLALVAIHQSLYKNGQSIWDFTQPINTWKYVKLNENGCVDRLELDERRFDGTIPAEIGELSELTYLDLRENFITGTVPTEIGNLTNLKILLLGANSLRGPLPATIGQMYSLETVSFGGLQLTELPESFSNLKNLKQLYLGYNQLTEFPISVRGLSKLETLLLNNNQISGQLPIWLAELNNLSQLYVQNNELSACFDEALITLCNQLNPTYNANRFISDGNNFFTNWENFCETGICEAKADLIVENCNTIKISDQTINTGKFSISNIGEAASTTSLLRIYLSLDENIDSNTDRLIIQSRFPPLQPGRSLERVLARNLDEVTPPITAGTYYVGFKMDILNEVDEANENNNTCFATEQFEATYGCKTPSENNPNTNYTYHDPSACPACSNPPCKADLVVENCNTIKISGQTINTGKFSISNFGNEASTESFLRIYLSLDENIDSDDRRIIQSKFPPIQPGESIERVLSRNIAEVAPPIPAGTYYIGFAMDVLNDVDEANENNNTCFATEQFEVTYGCKTPSDNNPNTNYTYNDPSACPACSNPPCKADLLVENCNTITITDNTVNTGKFSISNIGGLASTTSLLRIYLSLDENIDSNTDRLIIQSRFPPLQPGRSLERVLARNLDEVTPPIIAGTYYVGFKMDILNEVDEANENNNTCFDSTIDYNIQDCSPCPPDLLIDNCGIVSISGTTVNTGKFTVSNRGSDPVNDTFLGVYLSLDETIDNNDHLIAQTKFSLAPGESLSRVLARDVAQVVPAVAPGNYYVGLLADRKYTLNEVNEENNSCYDASKQFTYLPENRLSANSVNSSYNYPNPFSKETTIAFELSTNSQVTLFVTDVTGKKIATLLNNEPQMKGLNTITFNGADFATGIYYYTIMSGDFTMTQKMILMK